MSERSIFLASLDIPDPADRAAYLDLACGANPALRRGVEDLFAAHARSGTFMPEPAAAPNTRDYTPAEGPGARVGPYKLLEQIGEGGMGTVYMAEQTEPVRRTVALKIIRVGMDSKAVLARFDAERQALALMDHPNIARVLDAGTTPAGRPFFVMELVKGIPITKFCDDHRLGLRERLELFVPVCQAIQHAHQKGIIHRDVKPSNVLVALYDDRPVPKVIDFGVAKAAGPKLTDQTLYTAFGAVVGTLEYMSPEQAKLNQLDVDTRSDVYSLGVLLYELLTGTTPLTRQRLKSAALDEVLRLIREEEPERPSTRLSTAHSKPEVAAARKAEPARLGQLLRGELDWIVLKALEKDRTRRYETANGLVKDVQRFLADEAVEACPPTVGYRLRKAYRKNRPAVLAGAAFVGLLAVSVVTATVLALQTHQSKQVAVAERVRAEAGEAEANDQRDRAQREQQRAEQEKRAADAVRMFLQNDLLRQASLLEQANTRSVTGGDLGIKPNPTIEELLDRAASFLTPEEIEKKFPNMPFVQAEVLQAVANAYGGINKGDKAMALIDRAVPLYVSSRGKDDPATLQARMIQARCRLTYTNASEGEKLFGSLAADCDRVLGPDNRIGFDAANWLGRSMLFNGRHVEGLEYFKKLKAKGTRYFGAEDPMTIFAAGHIALAYRMASRIPEAIREIEDVLKTVRSAKIRPDHPMIDTAFGELAEYYSVINQPQKAIDTWREVIIPLEQRGEPYHWNTWFARHSIGILLEKLGDNEAAMKLSEENIRAAHSANRTFISNYQASRMAEKCGLDDKALEFARSGYTAIMAGQPATHREWYTGMARNRIGELLLKRKDYGETEPLLTAAIADLTEFDDKRPEWDNAKQLASSHKSLEQLYTATNRPAEAARIRRERAEFSLRKAAGGSNPWELYSSGDYALAAKMFEAKLKAAKTAEDQSKAYHGMFQSEHKLGNIDVARKYAQASIDVIVSARGPAHRSYMLGKARSNMGWFLVEINQKAEAEPHLIGGCREVAEFPDQIPSYDYPHRAGPFDYLIQLLEESNRPDEAKQWAAVRQELLVKLLRKTLAGGKITAATVTLATQIVLRDVESNRPDEALALYRMVNVKYTPADKSVANAWLRLSGHVFNLYEAKLQFDRMKPWAELRIPPLERDLDTLRESKPAELPLLRARNTLAFSYLYADRKADVVKLAEEAIARQKANGWLTDADTVASYGSTSKAVALAGRSDMAVEMSSAVLAEVKKANPTPAVLAAATFNLGFAKTHAGEHAAGEGLFRDALKWQTEADAKHWTAAKYKAWLGFTLHEQKKFTEAEPILKESYAECVERMADLPTWEKQLPMLVAGRLISLYQTQQKLELVKKWQSERAKHSRPEAVR